MSLTDALQLNNTRMFEKIRKEMLPADQSQNILDCIDDLLFVWYGRDSCVLVTNWRAVQLKQSFKDFNCQKLIPSTPQNFDVKSIVVSSEGSLIALVGPRGVAIMELPRRWGSKGLFMEGKPKISCPSCSLDGMLFNNNPQLFVRQLRWHPGSSSDSDVLVLLSDNTIRFYTGSKLRHIWQVGPIQNKFNVLKSNSSFGSFGEVTIDFDFAPAVKVGNTNITPIMAKMPINETMAKHNDSYKNIKNKNDKYEWPLVILRENGNIYVLMTSLDSKNVRLQGPLTISPQRTDNYGSESCAILVMSSLPPTLVIAETNGKLHHALFLNVDSHEKICSEADNQINIYPSEWTVQVLETVELELGLPKASESSNNTHLFSPIQLKRDYINELRYFAYHNTGLHVITVHFISELQRFMETELINDFIFPQASASAEYLVCTKIDSSENINTVLGFVLLQMPASLVLLLSSGQIISLKVAIDAKLLLPSKQFKWQSTDIENQYGLVIDTPFVDHMKALLRRSLTQPILSTDKAAKPSSHDCYELLNQALHVLRTEYVKKHELVRAEFAKRLNRIHLLKEQQMQDIKNLECDREVIRERAHKLAERFEEINDHQEVLNKKCTNLMRQANKTVAGNVATDREFAQDVASINKVTKNMASALDIIKKSIKRQRYHISKNKETNVKRLFELPEKQNKTIAEVLAQMGIEIDRQIKEVKNINSLVGL